MRKAIILVLLTLPCLVWGQSPVAMHSHNDYERTVPFFEAYSQHCVSIEADVYLQDGEILVAHDRKDVRADRSLKTMYIEPIVRIFRENGGRMWRGSDDRLDLVIDLKTAESMPGVVALFEQYPDVFASGNGVRVLIGGEKPAAEDFDKWPSWLWFIGRFEQGKLNFTPDQLSRIAVISARFRDFAKTWNGKGRMDDSDFSAVRRAIEDAHRAGKPIRFWGAPDTGNVYLTFYVMGADIINTDDPARCRMFFEERLKVN